MSCDFEGHKAYVTPTRESTAAVPVSHQTIGDRVDDAGAAASAADDWGASVGIGVSTGISNVKSAGTMVPAVDDSESAGSKGLSLIVSAARGALALAQPAGGTICTMLPHLGQA
jgi:hypothetical protein